METNAKVTYEVEDRIATIAMSRPQKFNAVDDDMVHALMAAMDRFDMDEVARELAMAINKKPRLAMRARDAGLNVLIIDQNPSGIL